MNVDTDAGTRSSYRTDRNSRANHRGFVGRYAREAPCVSVGLVRASSDSSASESKA